MGNDKFYGVGYDISDMILDKENDFSEIFSPKRFDLSLQ